MKLQEIIRRTDIVSLIEHNGTPLKKSHGNEYAGCCPFHDEKKPSFSVNSQKGTYHCFSCGAKGNAFTFAREQLHLEKRETVEYLKRFNGIIDDVDCSGYESLESTPTPVYTPKPKKVAIDTSALNRAVCQEILDFGRNMPHPYLEKKGISQYAYLFGSATRGFTWLNHDTQQPFTIDSLWLVAELVDRDLNPTGFQAISNDGAFKPFIGRLKGAYFVINPPMDDDVAHVYLCEGIATGLSIYAGDESRFVVCCMSAGQLASAVREWQMKYPTAVIRIMADNDVNSEPAKGNPGYYAALKAKGSAIEKKLVEIYLPPIINGKKTDWNDVAITTPLADHVIKQHLVETKVLESLSRMKTTANAVALICELAGVIPEREIKRLVHTFAMKFVISTVQINTIANQFPLFHSYLVGELARLEKIYEGRRRSFSTIEIPTQIQESRYLENVNFVRTPEVRNITFLHSGLGSGKTQQIRGFIKSLPADSRILYVTPRMSLSTAVAQDMGITDYQDILKTWKYSESHNLSIVINSIFHVAKESYDVVILDESEQILRQITSSLIKDKKLVMTALETLLRRANTVILADAHISDISVGFMSRVMTGVECDTLMVTNHFAARQGRVMNVYQSDKECFQTLMNTLKKGKKVYIATNTLKSSYSFDEAIRSLADVDALDKGLQKIISTKRVKIINGDNSQSFENRAFMRDFNKSVQDVDILIASPSITSGVSNFTPHFDAVFGFFRSGYGLNSPQDCAQQLARIRYETECHVFYDNFCDTELPLDRAEIIQKMEILFKDAVDAPSFQTTDLQGKINPYVWLYLDVKLNENVLKHDARQMFFALARHDGWSIEAIDVEFADEVILKNARSLVKKQEEAGVVNARDLAYDEYLKLKQSDNLTREDRYAAKKYGLKAFFDVQNDEELAVLVANEQKLGLRDQVNSQIIIRTNEETCRAYDQQRFHAAQEKWAEPHFRATVPIKTIGAQIVAAFGFSSDGHVTADSTRVQNVVKWFVDNQAFCEAHGVKFNTESLKSSPIKILSKIGTKLGFKVMNKVVRKLGLARVYWIDGCDDIVERAVKKQMSNGTDFISKTVIFPGQSVAHTTNSLRELNTSVTLH